VSRRDRTLAPGAADAQDATRRDIAVSC